MRLDEYMGHIATIGEHYKKGLTTKEEYVERILQVSVEYFKS